MGFQNMELQALRGKRSAQRYGSMDRNPQESPGGRGLQTPGDGRRGHPLGNPPENTLPQSAPRLPDVPGEVTAQDRTLPGPDQTNPSRRQARSQKTTPYR